MPITEQFQKRHQDQGNKDSLLVASSGGSDSECNVEEGDHPSDSINHSDNGGNHSSLLVAAKRKLQMILNVTGNALFQLFTDPVEKCRLKAIECVRHLCLSALDMGKHMAYGLPHARHFSKYPSIKCDPDMKIFITDVESHAFYKRGGAT